MIDHEIISSVILLLIQEGCCELQAKVCAQSTHLVNPLVQLAQETTIAVKWDVKNLTKQNMILNIKTNSVFKENEYHPKHIQVIKVCCELEK